MNGLLEIGESWFIEALLPWIGGFVPTSRPSLEAGCSKEILMRKLLLSLAFLVTLRIATAQNHENSPAMRQHFGHGTPTLSPLLDIEHKTFEIQPKGRWTLIYFWADWCEPCVAKGIPDLIAFTNAHESDRNRFQIVAIRFGSTHENFEWKD